MRALAPLVLLALLLAGCASSAVDPVGGRLRTEHHGKTVLQWGLVGVSDIPTLDPALASDSASLTVSSLLYGGLVRFDGKLRVRPDGASHWRISRDGKQYTFYLRKNLRFSDGRRVTASDFASALGRALGPEGSAGTAPVYLQLISQAGVPPRSARGITVVNPSTLRITLTRPAAHFLAELAFPASFVPDPALRVRYGASWTDHASGFGPFMVREWRHSRYLTLVRNPYYFGGASPLRRITLHFSTEEAAVEAYRQGKYDIVSGTGAGEVLPSDVQSVRRVPALALDYLAFNVDRLPFRRINARRAFAAAIGRDIVRTAMNRTAFPATAFLPSAFGVSSSLWHASSSPATYLKQARYRRAESFPRVVLITPQDSQLYALAHALKRAWDRALHVDVDVRTLNTSNYTQVLDARVFDLALVRWGGDYPDAQDFLGTQLGPSPDNVTGWTKPGYSAAIRLADSYSPADPRRVRLLKAAAYMAAHGLPIVPLDEPAFYSILRPELHGITLTPLGTVTLNPAKARFSG